MSLEAIELMSEEDRKAYAAFLARELAKPDIQRAPHLYPRPFVPSVTITGHRWSGRKRG